MARIYQRKANTDNEKTSLKKLSRATRRYKKAYQPKKYQQLSKQQQQKLPNKCLIPGFPQLRIDDEVVVRLTKNESKRTLIITGKVLIIISDTLIYITMSAYNKYEALRTEENIAKIGHTHAIIIAQSNKKGVFKKDSLTEIDKNYGNDNTLGKAPFIVKSKPSDGEILVIRINIQQLERIEEEDESIADHDIQTGNNMIRSPDNINKQENNNTIDKCCKRGDNERSSKDDRDKQDNRGTQDGQDRQDRQDEQDGRDGQDGQDSQDGQDE